MIQNTRSKKIYRTLATFAVAAMLASVPVAAEATPTADISSSLSSATPHSYSGVNAEFNSSPFTVPGSFSVNGSVGGSIDLTGTFTDPATSTPYTGTLLSGTITSILQDTSSVYEFLFSVNSGTAAPLFGPVGHTTISIFSSTFATADTQGAPVPEPATMSLMLLGGSALIGLRRRHKLSAKA